MCQSHLSHFCHQSESECVCHGKHSRTVRCMNAACGKEFKSCCGAQLFCSSECMEQTALGRQILRLVESDHIHDVKKLRRRAQLRRADRAYRQTDKGRAARRAQRARNYRRHKEKINADSGESGLRW